MRRNHICLVNVVALSLALLMPGLPASPAQVGAQGEAYYFPETGHVVRGVFLDYWRRNGDLAIFGYPLTDEIEEGGLTVQHFERAVFELHPENRPPFNVLLRQVGTLVAQGRRDEGPFMRAGPVRSPNCTYFPETGHNLCAGFRGYWRAFGGLPVYGFPISEEFREVIAETGQTYIVQYFERQRFEWHPGEWPQRFDVLLGRLGAELLLARESKTATIEIPAAGVTATLPLHILVRTENPNDEVVAALRWSDGTELTGRYTALRGEDGRGVVVENFNWDVEGVPPMPPSQPATLEILARSGKVLARQQLTILHREDPHTQEVKVFWFLEEDGRPRYFEVPRRVPRTPAIGAAALEELLWGPFPPNLAGFMTAIPTPQEVLNYPGREPDWGPRVTLRGLTIANGAATADFSQEMRAYGGGSARVEAIREQITRTLMQFPTVRQVVIAIEGQTEGVLEP